MNIHAVQVVIIITKKKYNYKNQIYQDYSKMSNRSY